MKPRYGVVYMFIHIPRRSCRGLLEGRPSRGHWFPYKSQPEPCRSLPLPPSSTTSCDVTIDNYLCLYMYTKLSVSVISVAFHQQIFKLCILKKNFNFKILKRLNFDYQILVRSVCFYTFSVGFSFLCESVL